MIENDFKKAMLIIKGLAPLSMVSSIPGSFYRSSQEPTQAMLYGMLENIVGWHYSPEIRRAIKKGLNKSSKKSQVKFEGIFSESGYEPMLQQFIRINKLFLKPITESYVDFWTQHLKHNDKRHFDGIRNYDWRLAKEINLVEGDKEKEALLKGNQSQFPNYYQSPKRREFVKVTGEYIYEIEIEAGFVDTFLERIEDPVSPPYLGTSEGWVDLKIELV
jgi:CRISPR-associated protein Cas5